MSKLLQEYNETIQTVLGLSKKQQYYTVIRVHKRELFSLSYKSGAIDRITTDKDTGIGMYVFTESGHVAFGSTNDCSKNACVDLYNTLKKIASKNQQSGLDTASQIYELKKQVNLGQDKSHYQGLDIDNINIAWIVENLEKLDKYTKEKEPNISSLFGFNLEVDIWRIIRSDGTDVDWVVPKTRLSMSITLRNKSQTVNCRPRIIDITPELLFSNQDEFKSRILQSIDMLNDQLLSEAMVAKDYPIIIDADLGGMLAHEALGHPAESDLVESGGSVLSDKDSNYNTGEKIAHSEVTIEDHEEDLSHGYHPYGAFGNARLPVTIIDKGLLKESVSDVFSSKSIGVENKNCERSEAYYAPAIPRMSNTYISMNKIKKLSHPLGSELNNPTVLQSALKKDGVFKKYPKIVYLIEMAGGMVTPVTGDFMFGTSFVYELSEDKVEAKKPVSFSGNVIGALEALEYGMGDVQKNTAGFCGKSEQTAHVRSGGNKLLFFSPTNKIKLA